MFLHDFTKKLLNPASYLFFASMYVGFIRPGIFLQLIGLSVVVLCQSLLAPCCFYLTVLLLDLVTPQVASSSSFHIVFIVVLAVVMFCSQISVFIYFQSNHIFTCKCESIWLISYTCMCIHFVALNMQSFNFVK